MQFRSILRTSFGLTALALFLAMGSPAIVAQSADSEEISKLLTQAKSHAVLAADDADTLESYTNSTHSWESHSVRLAEMAEHVNAMGKVNKQLSDLSSQGSPWQQIAISRIDPLLREMADQLTATINHLKNNQSKIHMGPYRDYVQANHDVASRTAQMISDFVEYDKAKSKAESLERKLELPSPVKGD